MRGSGLTVTENERIDPETGAMLRRDVRSQSVVYRGFRTTVMLPGWYHDDSDDGVHTRDDTAVLDELNSVGQTTSGDTKPWKPPEIVYRVASVRLR
jgi:hypothetical protein